MTRYLFSGSSFGRVEQCPASAAGALPQVDAVNVDATRGVGLHHFLCLVNNGTSREAALHELPDGPVREWAFRIDVDALPSGLPEKSIAYDPVTGLARFTGDSQRRYRLEPGEVPMTPDLIVPGDDGDGPTVIDWKTTQYDHDVFYDLPQLEINCLGVAAAFGAEEASWAVGVITPDGAVAWQRGHLDAAKLNEVAERVRRTVHRAFCEGDARAALGERYVPDVRRGPWCRYCPAFVHCPATKAVLALACDTAPPSIAEPGPAYVRVQAIERFASLARDVIKDHVAQHGSAETGDGRAVTLDSRGNFKLKRI